MLDRQHGTIVFECDACGEVLRTDEHDFNEAAAILRNENWIARKEGDVWCHYCGDCR